jgi:O-antigen/teichoic acid export membrane protein
MMARAIASGDRQAVAALATRTRKWFVPSFVGCCAIGAAAFPHMIPRLVGNPAFAAGAVPFAVLMAGLAIASPYLPFAQVLLMADRPGWHTALVVAVVTINAVGNLLLVPLWGTVGVALAATIATVVSAILVRTLARACVGVRL